MFITLKLLLKQDKCNIQLKKLWKAGAHLLSLTLVTMEKLKFIRKSKNLLVDWFYSRYLNGISCTILSVASLTSSRGELGVFHHFTTVIFA